MCDLVARSTSRQARACGPNAGGERRARYFADEIEAPQGTASALLQLEISTLSTCLSWSASLKIVQWSPASAIRATKNRNCLGWLPNETVIASPTAMRGGSLMW